MTSITIAYVASGRVIAEQIAADLERNGYKLGELKQAAVLVAVASSVALADDAYQADLASAHQAGARVVWVATEPVTPPPPIEQAAIVAWEGPSSLAEVRQVVAAHHPRSRAVVDRRNLRWGLLIGGGLVALFVFYTWAIVAFDIEAPADEFEQAYTRSAATVGAFAQPFLPQSTAEAENFEVTLQSRQVSDELATVIVQTATQAASEGGFVPLPTGMIIAPQELSIVRQTATGGAIIRATQTARAEDAAFESIAATATQAAATANAQLEAQQLTRTAPAGG